MRYVEVFEGGAKEEEIAQIAKEYAEMGIDNYADYGVGAVLVVRYDGSKFAVYAGHNINLSGMQVKAHAEQLACFQLLMDIPEFAATDNVADIRTMMVNTTEDDFSLRCGHCLQVFTAVCDYLGKDRSDVHYTAAAKPEDSWEFEAYPLSYLLPESYTHKRSEPLSDKIEHEWISLEEDQTEDE